jgi:hypothetical protein
MVWLARVTTFCFAAAFLLCFISPGYVWENRDLNLSAFQHLAACATMRSLIMLHHVHHLPLT